MCPETTAPTLAALSELLTLYTRLQDLPQACALELLHGELTAEQRRWLSQFVVAWEAVEGLGA